jgi:hypothetical protein
MGEDAAIAAYVDAASEVLALPVAAEHRSGVIAAMTRLAAFGADVASVELANDVEVAGVFVP